MHSDNSLDRQIIRFVFEVLIIALLIALLIALIVKGVTKIGEIRKTHTNNIAYGVSAMESKTNNYSIQELQDFCVNKRSLTVIDVRYDQQLKEVFLVISHPSTVSVIDLEKKQEMKTGKLTSYSTTNLLFLVLEKGDVLSERLLVKKAEELRLPYLSQSIVSELEAQP